MPRRTPQRLELFGGPALVRDGAPVQVSPYQAALLTVLFTEGRDRMPRTRVQALLWTDPEERAVRHRLSQLVYQVNQKTGGRVVELAGESVRVHQGILQCDLDDFEELIRRPDFVAAGELMSRGFLAALPAPPTEAFEDWMGLRALSLRARLREKALASWAAAEVEQDWSRGRAAAEAMLLLDPDDEVVLRRVMKSRAMGGSVREAEAVYLAFADRVSDQGGWEPDDETRELLKTVRATYAKTDPPADVALPPRLEVPLCGRDEELAYLTRAIFHERPKASATTVTVSGEAGLGKTRLVEEAIQGARFRGYRVLRARPAELERNIPLNPLLEALNQPWVGPVLRGLEDPWRSVLLALMPQFHEGPGPLPEVPYVQPGSLPRRTYEAFFRLFQGVAETNRTLLFIDDAQWADETSAAVLQFMHRRWNQDNLTLVLTYREEELEVEQPLARFLEELSTEPQVTGIRLSELGEDSAKKLAESVAGDRLSDEALGEVVALAGGNPFFVIELAADYMADRGPERRGDGAPLPISIRQMLGRRMRELDDVSRQVVSALSVFAHPVSLARLTRMTAFAREECVEGLETLQRLRLVEWADLGVRCRHDVVRRAVYEGLSRPRSALLHGRVAEILESESSDPPKDQLALHYYRAGERELALKYALEAADGAEAGGAVPETIMYLELARKVADEPTAHLGITERLGLLLYRGRQTGIAAGLLSDAVAGRIERGQEERALELSLALLDCERLNGRDGVDCLVELDRIKRRASGIEAYDVVALALDLEAKLADRSGDMDRARSVLNQAETLRSKGGARARCRTNSVLALHAVFGDPKKGLAPARRAVKLADQAGLPKEGSHALHRLIVVLRNSGQLHTEAGREITERGLVAAKRTGDWASMFHTQLNVAAWLVDTGEFDAALLRLDRVRELLHQSEFSDGWFTYHWTRGELLRWTRHFEDAEAEFEAAEERYAESMGSLRRVVLSASRGLVDIELGRVGRALARAEGLGASTPEWTNDLTSVYCFKARLHSAGQRHDEALQVLDSAAREIRCRYPVFWLKLQLFKVRLIRDRTSAERVDALEKVHDLALRLDLPRIVSQVGALA
ncbi:MAG: ATP-binding protein [Longimicrobiales bacterium]